MNPLVAALGTRPRSKYRNRHVVMDGMRFDSVGESRWYAELLLREKAGEITDLKRQVKFPIAHNGIRLCTYIADATWKEDGHLRVGDFKGMDTALSRLKRDLVKAFYGTEVQIFRKGR